MHSTKIKKSPSRFWLIEDSNEPGVWINEVTGFGLEFYSWCVLWCYPPPLLCFDRLWVQYSLLYDTIRWMPRIIFPRDKVAWACNRHLSIDGVEVKKCQTLALLTPNAYMTSRLGTMPYTNLSLRKLRFT
jgi:hypothetical protein